jgi:antirestriction protein ArdC
MENGFESPNWITFKQAQALNAHVRKGEHGSLVVFAKTYQKTEKNQESGEDQERDIPFLKAYTVFNVEQVDGLPDQYAAKPPPKFQTAVERDQNAEAFIRNTGATIQYGGARASYSFIADRIKVPHPEAFRDMEAAYSTSIHELGHWTQHPSRLSIDFGKKVFADDGYAMAELFAELTACFVCADLELTPEPPEEHSAYIAHWLGVLRNDKRAIFTAASTAQKAVDYLYKLQPHQAPSTAPTETVTESPPDFTDVQPF